jgi:hypothetical protein
MARRQQSGCVRSCPSLLQPLTHARGSIRAGRCRVKQLPFPGMLLGCNQKCESTQPIQESAPEWFGSKIKPRRPRRPQRI